MSQHYAQHKATRRRSMQSALAHRKAADKLLDALYDLQKKWNAAMDKLDADTSAALDTDYASLHKISELFESDEALKSGPHKRTLRQTMRAALSHRRLADEICDALEELHVTHNAFLAKLDAQGGTLTDTDWASTLGIVELKPDSKSSAAHKATLRQSLRAALAHRRLADEILDALLDIQKKMNASMAALDAGSVNGAHAANKVSEIDPDK